MQLSKDKVSAVSHIFLNCSKYLLKEVLQINVHFSVSFFAYDILQQIFENAHSILG